jgi:hypothetical protein
MSVFMFFVAKLGMNGHSGLAAITGIIGGLAAAVIFLTGLSATGILLMDQAKENEIRSIGSALFAGLVTLPSMVGLFLLFVLMVVAVEIVLAIILWVCKIPGIGPLLYAFVFPDWSIVFCLHECDRSAFHASHLGWQQHDANRRKIVCARTHQPASGHYFSNFTAADRMVDRCGDVWNFGIRIIYGCTTIHGDFAFWQCQSVNGHFCRNDDGRRLRG